MAQILRSLIIFVTLIFGTVPISAQDNSDRIADAEIIELTVIVEELEYACTFVIHEAAVKGGAAILFLHGYGECGTDGEKQLTVGLPKHAMENSEDWPYVLIVPQKPIYNSEWEDHEDAVLRMLSIGLERGLYDGDRLAITGLSQGGHGTITLGSRHADLFVAAAPVCGYTERRMSTDQQRLEETGATPTDADILSAARELSGMPTWFFHGDDDTVVPVSESRSLHTALETIGADTNYTELPGGNHNAWDDAYTDDGLINWFKGQLSD